MGEWTDYFFQQKLLSLFIFPLLLAAWNRKHRRLDHESFHRTW